MDENRNAPSYEYATFPRRFLAYRWYKPLLVALLVIVFTLLFQMGVMGVGVIWAYVEGAPTDDGLFTGLDEAGSSSYFTGPGLLMGFGGVAMMLLALVLAALIVRDRPFSSYSSSRGGFNWGAFFKCLGVGVVVYAAANAVQVVFFPDENATGAITLTALTFVFAAFIVSLQAVAEEYVYRGLALQAFSSWTKLPAVGILASSLLFTISHGYNSIGLVAIFVGAVIWGVLAWQTRGLEATCAAHIVNNLSSYYAIGFGISSLSNEIDILSAVVVVLIDVVYAVAVIALSRKFNWFTSKGDGAVKANEAHSAKMAVKANSRP